MPIGHCPAVRFAGILLSAGLAACGTPPKGGETVWATVSEIYTAEKLRRPHNRPAAQQARQAGLTDADMEGGRVVRVACGVGPDYAWGSYAYLPAGVAVRDEQVVRVAVNDPGNDDRMGWNPVLDVIADFQFPGSSSAYRFIPDWKERGLSSNLEPIPLAPAQRGRYVISHSRYLIKCRPS